MVQETIKADALTPNGVLVSPRILSCSAHQNPVLARGERTLTALPTSAAVPGRNAQTDTSDDDALAWLIAIS